MARTTGFLIAMLVLCLQATAQPQQVSLRPLTNYNLEQKVTLDNGVNCLVFSSEKKFNKAFGILPGMPLHFDAPDFKTENVLVLAMSSTTTETTLKILRAVKAGNFIEVYCSIGQPYALTYTMYPIALAKIPKFKEITIIKFYDDRRRLLKEVKIR